VFAAVARPTRAGLELTAVRYEGSPGSVALAELAEDLGFLMPLKLESSATT